MSSSPLPPGLLELIYPWVESENEIAKSSPIELMGRPKCSITISFSFRLATNKSNPPILGCPSDEKYNFPLALTCGNNSSPGVFIVEPKLMGLPNLPELSMGTRYKSTPPFPPLRLELKYNVLSSAEKAGLPSQANESEILRRSGSDQLAAVFLEMYRSTSGEGSLLLPVFPLAKTTVFPSFVNTGVPSLAFSLKRAELNMD